MTPKTKVINFKKKVYRYFKNKNNYSHKSFKKFHDPGLQNFVGVRCNLMRCHHNKVIFK